MGLDFRIVYLAHRDIVPFPIDDFLMQDTAITYIHSGYAEYKVDGKIYKVSAGQAFCVPMGHYRARLGGTENAVYTSIIVKHKCPLPVTLPTVIESAGTYDVKYCVDKLTELYISSAPYAEEQIDILLKYLMYSLAAIADVDKKSRYVNDMKKYIEANFSAKLSLEEVAASVHLSKSYASALFRKETDMSINEYIIGIRIKQAGKMLKYTDESASDIAEKCGFCDIFYFSRAFKREKGISPQEYRKKHRRIGNEEHLGYYRQNFALDIELGIKKEK